MKIGNIDEMIEFDDAVVFDVLPNNALLLKDGGSEALGIDAVNYIIEYKFILDLDNVLTITLYCKKSESSKIKKIVQLVKQGKFLKK